MEKRGYKNALYVLDTKENREVLLKEINRFENYTNEFNLDVVQLSMVLDGVSNSFVEWLKDDDTRREYFEEYFDNDYGWFSEITDEILFDEEDSRKHFNELYKEYLKETGQR